MWMLTSHQMREVPMAGSSAERFFFALTLPTSAPNDRETATGSRLPRRRDISVWLGMVVMMMDDGICDVAINHGGW